mmetsp:Transcript_4383/g.13385  ORF Transcript_4383/g.13385 Transcript_4383/m.13385 type:complete len:254 (+) Transcript_4383:864-1625(+)
MAPVEVEMLLLLLLLCVLCRNRCSHMLGSMLMRRTRLPRGRTGESSALRLSAAGEDSEASGGGVVGGMVPEDTCVFVVGGGEEIRSVPEWLLWWWMMLGSRRALALCRRLRMRVSSEARFPLEGVRGDGERVVDSGEVCGEAWLLARPRVLLGSAASVFGMGLLLTPIETERLTTERSRGGVGERMRLFEPAPVPDLDGGERSSRRSVRLRPRRREGLVVAAAAAASADSSRVLSSSGAERDELNRLSGGLSS